MAPVDLRRIVQAEVNNDIPPITPIDPKLIVKAEADSDIQPDTSVVKSDKNSTVVEPPAVPVRFQPYYSPQTLSSLRTIRFVRDELIRIMETQAVSSRNTLTATCHELRESYQHFEKREKTFKIKDRIQKLTIKDAIRRQQTSVTTQTEAQFQHLISYTPYVPLYMGLRTTLTDGHGQIFQMLNCGVAAPYRVTIPKGLKPISSLIEYQPKIQLFYTDDLIHINHAR